MRIKISTTRRKGFTLIELLIVIAYRHPRPVSHPPLSKAASHKPTKAAARTINAIRVAEAVCNRPQGQYARP